MVALIARWKADTLGLANGATVTAWPDTAGIQGDMAENTAPCTYVTASQNGLGVVRLGAGAKLETTWAGGHAQPFTVFFAVKTPATGDATIAIGSWTGDAPSLYLNGADVDAMGGADLTASVVTPGEFDVFTCFFNGASSILRKNGVLVASGNAGTWPIVTGAWNVAYAGAASFDIGEYVIYTGDATAPAVEETALITKWLGAPVAPVADFTGTPVTGEAPYASVTFTDTSTNSPSTWDWDFGDDSAHGTTMSPTHIYTKQGTFTVSLTSTNAAGSDTQVYSNYIVIDPNPSATELIVGFAGYPDASTATPDTAAIAETGATWVRYDIDWSSIQPTNSYTFDWTDTDAIVDAALANGLTVLGLITYAPDWATNNVGVHPIPTSNTTFATFCTAVATRYMGKIAAYEIWNEPNIINFWSDGANVTEYIALLTAGYNAVKAVSSSLLVISAGLAPAVTGSGDIAPIDFVTSMYAGGAKPYFDHLAQHPYGWPSVASDESTSSWNSGQQTVVIRGIMATNTDTAKQIWITEFGAPSCNNGTGIDITEAEQGIIVADGLNYFPGLGYCGPIFIYELRDADTGTTNTEDNYGVLRTDGTPKVSYTAIQDAVGGGIVASSRARTNCAFAT